MHDAIPDERQTSFVFDYAHERRQYIATARTQASILYRKTGKPISIDDVREVCPPPAWIDPRTMGKVFQNQDWERVGETASSRGVNHGRKIALFQPTGVTTK